MCRIAGFASLENVTQREEVLSSMLNAVVHGGPDDFGTYFDEKVAIGHRRLAIIDLSPAGHQPMFLDDDLIISYNGEIYNYQELKAELSAVGIIFKTHSDTEVILQSYRHWGTKAFDRFEGIFAFALYDKRSSKLLLVRDHVGVKPLYYHIKDRVLVFGSEVRVFHQFNKNWRGDEKWKILFLAFGSIPHPYTTLENVYQLDAGAFMEINIDDFSHEVHFYSHSGRETANISSGNELSDVKDALIATIKKNLIADAPLGVFLSGGIDSSLITLLADEFKQGIKTLSINFDEATFDESPYQKQVVAKAKNVVHTSYRINEQIFWEDLPDIWRAMDQPTIDGVNSYFVSRCAHSEGLKAVLSGLGADEIFGGYASFKRVKWIRRIRKLPFKRTIAKLLKYWRSAYGRLTFLTIAGPIGDYLFLRGIHTPDVIAKILAIPEHKVWSALKEVKVGIPDKLDDRAYVSALESRIYMTNQLLKDTDCMSMWHALEARVPFLDIRLIRLMESIPVKKRYNEKVPKYLLTTCIPGLLPRDIIYRKKNGFTFPISVWLKNKPEYVRDLIDINVASQGIIDGFEKGDDHWSRCWSLAVLKQFK